MPHKLLENLSIFTWMSVLESEEKCLEFLEDFGLIPKIDSAPPCPLCAKPMSAHKCRTYKLGWVWVCSRPCSERVNPLKDTYFEDARIPFQDILAIAFCYVMDIGVPVLHKQMLAWRLARGGKPIAPDTIYFLNWEFAQIAETVMLREGQQVECGNDYNKLFRQYRRTRLDSLESFGNQVERFLLDMKFVYPGNGKKSIQLKESKLTVPKSGDVRAKE